ncbi:MAG TPA: hypothetical protein VKQ36_06615 [Ktedonobacterales bacterium]|nr:hypothetical protein [Ktedonobacterales bacterium]
MAQSIGLVAASQRQRGDVRQAREQFDASPLFRRARDYCERTYGEWYILSARHYLLTPQQVIGPDEQRLHTLPAEERLRWATQVAQQLYTLARQRAEPLTLVLFASQRYADLLGRVAPDLAIEQPLSGLSLRARLHWFDERLSVRSRWLGAPTQ